ELSAPSQGRIGQAGMTAPGAPVLPVNGTALVPEIGADGEEPGAYLPGVARERGGGRGIGADCGAAGAKNPGLLEPDRLAVGAEVIHVVEIHADHHRAIGVERVHRIEPAAEAHLEHRRLYPLLDEEAQRGE